MEKGYLYIASGEKYINEAVISLKSLKRFNQDAHVTLVTDKPSEITDFDEIIVLSAQGFENNQWKNGILFKVMGLQNSPYQKTFFVDSDTFFCDDCSELFRILDYYDLLIADAPVDRSTIQVDQVPLEGYYPYNTGVIVFKKNERTGKLLDDWLKLYKLKFDQYLHDQAPFMEALLANSIKLYVLKPIYNFRIPYFVSLPGLKVKILHGRFPHFDGLEALVNKTLTPRAWHPGTKRILLSKKSVLATIAEYSPKPLVKLIRKIRNKIKYS